MADKEISPIQVVVRLFAFVWFFFATFVTLIAGWTFTRGGCYDLNHKTIEMAAGKAKNAIEEHETLGPAVGKAADAIKWLKDVAVDDNSKGDR